MSTEAEARAALAFLLAAGADEAVADAPLNRFLPGRQSMTEPAKPKTPAKAQRLAPTPVALSPDAAQSARSVAAQCQDLGALSAAMDVFDGCALKDTATNLVFADGNPDARLMIVGEAPGREEDRQGKPFVGESGQLLDRMLHAIGLDRTGVYITNILPWRPPGNRKPTHQEIAICLPFIERHVELAQAEIVLLTGGTAVGALLGRAEGITRVRGRWLKYRAGQREVAALATFHPAYLLRQPGQKREVWQDLLKIQSRLRDIDA
jgi:DNA polymerase